LITTETGLVAAEKGPNGEWRPKRVDEKCSASKTSRGACRTKTLQSVSKNLLLWSAGRGGKRPLPPKFRLWGKGTNRSGQPRYVRAQLTSPIWTITDSGTPERSQE